MYYIKEHCQYLYGEQMNQIHTFNFNNTKILFIEKFNSYAHANSEIISYSSPELVFTHNNKQKISKLKPKTMNTLNNINWKCRSEWQIWNSINIVAPSFYNENNDVFDVITNHTNINSLNDDELILRILIKYFHNDLHKKIFVTHERELDFIISHDIQDTFFNIFKILVLRFLEVSLNPIINQVSLDNELNNVLISVTKPYCNDVSQIIHEIQRKNSSFFSNGKDFINYYHCENNPFKKSAKDGIQKAVELFNEIK